MIRSWGYRVVAGKHIDQAWRYTAGTVEQRNEDLCWAMEDPEVDIVWLARGGFGLQHCLPHLPVFSEDKIVIGYSDATALLNFLYLRGHRKLIHGPLVDTLATEVDDATRARVQQLLQHPESNGSILGNMVINPDSTNTSGLLIGGNITMLASLVGTPWAARTCGSILMLEDITEHAFRLDRCLVQLLSSGALDGVRAIVLGEFIRCFMPAGADYSASELVADILRPLNIPIIQGAPFGHGKKNLAWPFGRLAKIEGSAVIF